MESEHEQRNVVSRTRRIYHEKITIVVIAVVVQIRCRGYSEFVSMSAVNFRREKGVKGVF